MSNFRHVAFVYNSMKVVHRATDGLPSDYALEVDFDMYYNHLDIDTSGQDIDLVESAKVTIPGVALTDDLGLTYGDVVVHSEALGAIALANHYKADLSQDWCGQGNTGHSAATNDLLSHLPYPAGFDYIYGNFQAY